jgi:two-component system chemotaxis response regulator CheB
VARAFGNKGIGVLLTGMGDDGAAVLLEMKQAGALTIAQDEASSVVFGMPAEAIRLGAVDHVLRPEAMPEVLLKQVARKESGV